MKKFAYQRFEPSGFTKNPDIRNASSITDYVFRWLGCQFIKGYKEATSPQPLASRAAAERNRRHGKEVPSIARSPIFRGRADRT